MKVEKLFILIIALGLALAACTTPPPEQPAPEPPAVVEPEPTPEYIEAEDPLVKITQEEYDKTFAEVEAVIEELNTTIKAKNMQKWESYLTPKFRSHLTSRQYLAELNDSPLLKRNNITITNLKEYFDTVVVPSRANVRLDDLKFTDAQRVQAYMTISNKDNVKENILIYQLEKTGADWKISLW
ncbi:MAG: hypothetical protein LBQ57_05365 [Spirochaetales bacterium]|jgi:hypothetical protein|nr:hypothetical protein [Spirochaetales bacterium]